MTTKSRQRSGGGKSNPPPPTQEPEAQDAGKRDAQAQEKVKSEAEDTAEAAQQAAQEGEDSDNTSREGEQPGPEHPERHAVDGGNAAGDAEGSGPTIAQQAETSDVLHIAGDPVPAEVDRGMVRDETGISPAPFVLGSEGEQAATTPTAPTGDDERNGKPLGIGTDTSGEMRRQDPAVPTAATGAFQARNGAPVNMADQVDTTGELRKRDPAAKLAADGVRAEVGVGTLNRELPPDERPTYPSSTLTRATPEAAPMEPDDVRRVTEPKLGHVQTSTDPIAAAAAIRSHAGDDTVDLLDAATGEPIKPSGFFEVPDGPQARTLMRCNARVVEVYTVRHVKTPSRRLLFTEGQMVPVAMAETLIALHG